MSLTQILKRMNKFFLMLFVLIYFFSGVPISFAMAEGKIKTAKKQNKANSNKSFKAESMTVTAQKKEEKIQDVPISLTVFDEHAIEDEKIESVIDIAKSTPGFSFVAYNFGGWLTPVMRGLSSSGGSLSSSAAMFIDGIPVSNFMGFDESLMDIERIEVLKGPQGSLYGKDTEAGAINIITKQPDNTTKIKTGVQFGSDNKREYSFSASGALIKDKFFIGLSGRHYEKDGQIKNTYSGGILDNRENNYGKLHLRATPNDDLDISFISSYCKKDDDGPYYNLSSATDKEVPSDIEGYNKDEISSHSLKVKYNIGSYNLAGIATQREYKGDALSDLDFSPGAYAHNKVDCSYKRRSLEFRLSSEIRNFNWLVGVYADKDKNHLRDTMVNFQPQLMDDRSVGLFAHSDYKFNEKFSLITGVRYDDDKKTFKREGTDTDLKNSYNAFSPKIAVNYKLNDKSMVYSTISSGYKSGGFDLLAPEGRKAYDKETLINYEIGSKNIFFDNALIVNAAIYYMDISDMQVSSEISIQGQTYITNAATATSKGLELEARYKASDALELFGSLGVNNSEFDKYRDLAGDYSGNTNPYAPEYTYNIGTQYRSPGGFFARIDLNGYGKTYLDKKNKYKRKAYNLVNSKIGYERESFDVYLYGENIFDEEYDSKGEFINFYSQPGEIGVQVAYRF